MNSTDERKNADPASTGILESLTVALWKVENLITKLTDKYLATEMPAKTFMRRQTPLLMQRSVLVAKIRTKNSDGKNECVQDSPDNDSKPDNSPD